MTIEEFKRLYPEYEEEIEERAAIMEYDGGLSRRHAERWAVMRIKDKYNLWGIKND